MEPSWHGHAYGRESRDDIKNEYRNVSIARQSILTRLSLAHDRFLKLLVIAKQRGEISIDEMI